MTSQINRETKLTDEMMMDHESEIFMAVVAYIAENSRVGDPDQSLMDWVANGDYNGQTVGEVIKEWDGGRDEEAVHEAAVRLGRQGGSVGSKAQKSAARQNGRKGGRPHNPIYCDNCETRVYIVYEADNPLKPSAQTAYKRVGVKHPRKYWCGTCVSSVDGYEQA